MFFFIYLMQVVHLLQDLFIFIEICLLLIEDVHSLQEFVHLREIPVQLQKEYIFFIQHQSKIHVFEPCEKRTFYQFINGFSQSMNCMEVVDASFQTLHIRILSVKSFSQVSYQALYIHVIKYVTFISQRLFDILISSIQQALYVNAFKNIYIHISIAQK